MSDDVTSRELKEQHYNEFGLVELYLLDTTEWQVEYYIKSNNEECSTTTLSYEDAKDTFNKVKELLD